MADSLTHLEQALRYERNLTRQEEHMLAWEAQVIRQWHVGIAGGFMVGWLATKRLSPVLCVHLTFGTAFVCGIWKSISSVKSSVEGILSMEGSRIQRELANIMLKDYQNNPRMLQYLRKHFYIEEVYEESSVDTPVLRWHSRNFDDPITYSQNTSYSNETDSHNNAIKKTTTEPKQVSVNAAPDVVEDPFDLIFGLPQSAESVAHPDKPTTSSRILTRREKRSHRSHRRHHHQKKSDI